MSDIAEKEFTAAADKLFAGDEAPRTNPLFGLGTDLLSEFAEAETMRRETEQRWLTDLRQFKGVYEPDEEAKMTGSKAFLRKTRVKVKAVTARMKELLFPANREKNYEIKETPDPSLPPAVMNSLVAAMTQANGGTKPTKDEVKAAVQQYASDAAKRMATRIDDQLAESNYRAVSGDVMLSGHLYGTGILKGPLVERRTRISYTWDDKAGNYVQQTQSFSAPFMTHVPVWRWYPDMTVTKLRDCRYVWEHHRLGRSDLAEMATRKSFDGDAIRAYLDAHPQGSIKVMQYEHDLRAIKDEGANTFLTMDTGQYDVLERWGWITGDKMRACGVDIPDKRLHEAFFSNLWVLPDGHVIKAILAPIEGVQWPYHLYYTEKDETSIFGDGYAAIMRDDQKMINAAGRMLLDNAAITSGPQFEVDLRAFPPNADLTNIYSRKIWPRTGGDMQYPAVRQLSFNAHIQELSAILALFDTNADDTTSVPKFTYGDNPKGGAAGTMGGLSMLMAQANIALKDQVTGYDQGITEPFISALYHWNMKFSSDPAIKGDFDVKARGASSLIAKEVRSMTLAQFGATLQPEERPFIKWDQLARQKAETQDLVDIIKTDEEVEADMANPATQASAQMEQMAAQLQLALLQGKVAEQAAKAAKLDADTLNRRVEAIYAAMQAAGVAASNPQIAPIGDAMIKSAGWVDAGQPVEQVPQQAQPPEAVAPATGLGVDEQTSSAHAGQRAGIETMEVTP